MRNDLRENFEHLQKRIQDQKASMEEIARTRFELNSFVVALCSSADDLRRLAMRYDSEAREYALLRDILDKEMP